MPVLPVYIYVPHIDRDELINADMNLILRIHGAPQSHPPSSSEPMQLRCDQL